MRYYLDTSALRKNANEILNYSDKKKIFTSSLTIFELISGISENEYMIRKTTLKKILDSNIFIDWNFFKKKMFEAFKIPYFDIEGYLIKKMAEFISTSESFEDVVSKRIYISEKDYYTLENFKALDHDISKAGVEDSVLGINEWRQLLPKGHRRDVEIELFENKGLDSFVQLQTEVYLSSFTEIISGTQRPSEEYFESLGKYDGNLNLYFYCNQLKFSLSQLKGMQYGKNDTLDLMHTLYMLNGDIIISDDKIFKKLEDECNRLTCYSSDEFFKIKQSI